MVHPSRAEEVLRRNQEVLKAKVTWALGGSALKWSDSPSPCLVSLDVLAAHWWQGLDQTVRKTIVCAPQAQTALEGHQGAKLVLASSYECSVAQMAFFCVRTFRR